MYLLPLWFNSFQRFFFFTIIPHWKSQLKYVWGEPLQICWNFLCFQVWLFSYLKYFLRCCCFAFCFVLFCFLWGLFLDVFMLCIPIFLRLFCEILTVSYCKKVLILIRIKFSNKTHIFFSFIFPSPILFCVISSHYYYYYYLLINSFSNPLLAQSARAVEYIDCTTAER